MQKIFPNKLKKGDEIRIIAPARSLSILSEDLKNTAIKNLEKLGFTVTFSQNCEEIDLLNSSSISFLALSPTLFNLSLMIFYFYYF